MDSFLITTKPLLSQSICLFPDADTLMSLQHLD